MNKLIIFMFFLLGASAMVWAAPSQIDGQGRQHYLSYGCALCHGWDGRGDGINAQKFDPPPTNFHDRLAYLHGSDANSIRRSIQYGIKEDKSIMPAFEDIPSQEMGQIIDYLQSLREKDEPSKGIIVSNAWVQAMPPSQTTSAAYLTITNNSLKEIVLVSATSEVAGAVEIHQMSDRNGMMKMAMAAQLPIPAQGKVSLQPGGFHIMLINLKRAVNNGDIVPITLHFQDGSSIVVNARAKMQEADASSNMPGMKM